MWDLGDSPPISLGSFFPYSVLFPWRGIRELTAGLNLADVALSQKVEAEIQYEKQTNAELPETPEFLKAFREQGVWAVSVT